LKIIKTSFSLHLGDMHASKPLFLYEQILWSCSSTFYFCTDMGFGYWWLSVRSYRASVFNQGKSQPLTLVTFVLLKYLLSDFWKCHLQSLVTVIMFVGTDQTNGQLAQLVEHLTTVPFY